MKRKLLMAVGFIFLIYFSSYLWFRQTRTEVWEQDGNAYVLFPADKVYIYYFYRPLSYIDGAIAGMRFHIGRHG